MVYRGKPSAGCENCRKAKKRCDLEQPACSRCVKLKKVCIGYRDTNALQIQDETSSVKWRVDRQNAKSQVPTPAPTPALQTKPHYMPPSTHLAPPGIEYEHSIPTPASISSDSTSSSDSTIEIDPTLVNHSDGGMDVDPMLYSTNTLEVDLPENSLGSYEQLSRYDLTFALKPKPDDVASNYFFANFTANNHWRFMRTFAANRKLDPCLELALKACGMAALDNVQNVVMGKEYAQSMYVEALGLLNDALRDPKRCKTDESLIAVAMLGYYENLTCDGPGSILSWKAHVKGATQLLKIRGKNQFRTSIGRTLFREIRNQIMLRTIWDDEASPDFLWEYQSELEKYTEQDDILKPVDELSWVIFSFANLRAKIRFMQISDMDAAEEAAELERRIIEWSVETPKRDERWRYTELEVEDSPDVWGNMVHSFRALPGPSAWNTIRSVRCMLTRTQEMLCLRLPFSDADREEQMQYFRKTRRVLTDEVCAAVPAALGHAAPAFNSACVLITAYAAIWPLFFACTCALERVGTGAASILNEDLMPPGQLPNRAAAQARWIMSRLEYISKNVGLKWADGVLAMLRGEFDIPERLITDDDVRAVPHYSKVHRAMWLKKTEKARREAQYRIEASKPLKDAFTRNVVKGRPNGPVWLGRAVE